MQAAVGASVEALWRVQELMAHLSVKKSWVYARVESGELPVVRLPGGRIRFVPRDVAAWVERQKSRPAQILALHKGS